MYSSNYKSTFGGTTATNTTFGAPSTSTFGQPTANTPMFSSMQPASIFQSQNPASFTAGPSTQAGFEKPCSTVTNLNENSGWSNPPPRPMSAPSVGRIYRSSANIPSALKFDKRSQYKVRRASRPVVTKRSISATTPADVPQIDLSFNQHFASTNPGPLFTTSATPMVTPSVVFGTFTPEKVNQIKVPAPFLTNTRNFLQPFEFSHLAEGQNFIPAAENPFKFAAPIPLKTCDSPMDTSSLKSYDSPMDTSIWNECDESTYTNENRANLFGQPQQQPSTSGLFSSSNAFGQNKASFGFGATAAQPSLFGQQQPQQPTGSSLFQSNAPNLFGSASAFGAQGQSGTVVKFSPVTGTDTMQKNGVAQSISTKHHCITCMKEYENKSLEELRFEDYSVNRKGPTQQQGFGAAPFGAAAAPGAANLFGQTDNKSSFGATPAFGQANTFGQTTPSFGLTSQTSTPSLFGKPTFGAATSSTNSFGFNTAQATANPFSASQAPKPFASQPLFGTATTQAQPSFGTGVFGQTSTQNTTANLFQKPAQPAAGFNTGNNMFSFNQTTTTQAPNLFNVSKPNPGFGIFGSTNTGTATFGQPNTLGANFGKPATTAFGQPTQPTFGTNLGALGQPQQQQPLFGTAAPKPTGLFGSASTSGNLFSNNVFQQPTQTPFSMSGLNQQQPTQFSSENANETKFVSMLATDSFPDGPHVYGLEPVFKDGNSSTTNPQDLKSLLDVSKKREELAGTRSKIQVHQPKSKRGGNKEFFDTNQALKSSHKCLVIRKFNDSANTIYNKYKNALIEEAEDCLKMSSGSSSDSVSNVTTPNSKNHSSEKNSPNSSSNIINHTTNHINHNHFNDIDRDFANPKKVGMRLQFEDSVSEEPDDHSIKVSKSTYTLDDSVTFSPLVASSQAHLDDELPHENGFTSPSNISLIEPENTENPAGVTLSKPEYYMYPPQKDLHQYIDNNGRCMVQGLTIGRRGYGNVYYSEPVDITNMNLDEIIYFRHREIIVYPDDATKPAVGDYLNRPAQVTLDKIYPREKGTNQYITDISQIIQSNFVENLMNITQKHNCKFVDYRPKTGSWVFKVRHFSKYAFTDSDEEECEVFGDKIAALKKKQELPGKKIAEIEDITMGLGGTLSNFMGKPQGVIDLVNMTNGNISPDQFGDSNLYRDDFMLQDSSLQTIKSSLFTNLDKAAKFEGSLVKTISKERPIAQFRSEVISSPKIHKLPEMSFAIMSEKITSTQRCYSEMGIFKNNTFKVGWGKACNFYNFSMVYDSEVIYGLTSSVIQTEDIDNCSKMMPNITDMLEITLEESEVVFDSNKTPTFSIKEDLGFLQKQTMLFNDYVRLQSLGGKDRYLSSVWNLCTALWGRGDDSAYSRRQYFSDWLKRFSYDLSDEWNLSDTSQHDKAFENIFKLLSFHKVAEAAEFAAKNNLSKISVIISQLCANERFKLWMKKYVGCFAWNEKGLIPDEFKRLYLLLSGIPIHGPINVCQDLDWLRSLGVHLWYVAPAAAPIDVAVNLYRKAFEETEYAVTPNPKYCDRFAESETYDLLYHIILLYTNSTYQLCNVLHPATHTENLMDYRVSWHLLQLFLSLKVGLVRQSEKDHLHTTFSNQLENMGHWKYAIFILLFLENNTVKKNLSMRILERHLSAGVGTKKTEDELVNIFKVPVKWIHEVKAIKAKLSGNFYEYFQHLRYMESWQEANSAFVEHILPELFINEQFTDLLSYIKKIEPLSSSIEGWNTQVGLVKDFLEMDELLRHSDESFRFASGKLHSLCRRAGCFPVKNDAQRLCIAELSRKCALLFKILYKNVDRNVFGAKFVDIINSLIMPPDYKHLEIFYLIGKLAIGDE